MGRGRPLVTLLTRMEYISTRPTRVATSLLSDRGDRNKKLQVCDAPGLTCDNSSKSVPVQD